MKVKKSSSFTLSMRGRTGGTLSHLPPLISYFPPIDLLSHTPSSPSFSDVFSYSSTIFFSPTTLTFLSHPSSSTIPSPILHPFLKAVRPSLLRAMYSKLPVINFKEILIVWAPQHHPTRILLYWDRFGFDLTFNSNICDSYYCTILI